MQKLNFKNLKKAIDANRTTLYNKLEWTFDYQAFLSFEKYGIRWKTALIDRHNTRRSNYFRVITGRTFCDGLTSHTRHVPDLLWPHQPQRSSQTPVWPHQLRRTCLNGLTNRAGEWNVSNRRGSTNHAGFSISAWPHQPCGPLRTSMA